MNEGAVDSINVTHMHFRNLPRNKKHNFPRTSYHQQNTKTDTASFLLTSSFHRSGWVQFIRHSEIKDHKTNQQRHSRSNRWKKKNKRDTPLFVRIPSAILLFFDRCPSLPVWFSNASLSTKVHVNSVGKSSWFTGVPHFYSAVQLTNYRLIHWTPREP